jgi:hypothetical protein
MGRAINPEGLSPASVLGPVISLRIKGSSRRELSRRKPRVIDLQPGTRLRYRATGSLFEIKKITGNL